MYQYLNAGLFLIWLNTSTCAFQINRNLESTRIGISSRLYSSKVPETEDATSSEHVDNLEVILFGLGDLRADDHEGLRKSLEAASQHQNSRVLPLIILDEESVANFPGAVALTQDTACLIAEAIRDLSKTLRKMDLQLHVDLGSGTTLEGLTKVLAPYLDGVDIRVHVCDHGLVDNSIEYTPFGTLQGAELPFDGTIVPWSCELRNAPWENLDVLPNTYDEYTKKFNFEPTEPVVTDYSKSSACSVVLDQFTETPSSNRLGEFLQQTLDLDPVVCQAERNSGLYSTHWGGLNASTVAESKVLQMIRLYVDACKEEDEVFAEKLVLDCTRNLQSLEHATMIWNLRGDGTKKDVPETNNILAGELMIRYLLAPLLLGTISPRRLWYAVKKTPTPFFVSPLRTLVETREWHQLFASKCLCDSSRLNTGMKYNYWRWHGFLCRYGEQTVAEGKSGIEKQGILFIHGFGASGSQWQRTINALKSTCSSHPPDDSTLECLAPDLIGFGQSEKPAITYSGFTWESYTSDFIKEVARRKNKWQSFVIGGNSIGGFVGMCAAANDATTIRDAISGIGAPGTGRCAGVVLMNPAGVIQSKDDVAAIESSVLDKSKLPSVAQVIANDGLAPCKPLPRPITRLIGNGLLSYLRPRIQSICVNLYPTNPDAVDDDLCQNILRDSLDPGAINVMISGSKLPTPRTYNEVVAADFGQSGSKSLESQFTGPVLLAQGILDPLNDAKGRARQLKTLRNGIQVAELEGGHCPHDEIPEQVAAAMVNWMKDTKSERLAMIKSSLQTQQG